jgi:hypothetical protein
MKLSTCFTVLAACILVSSHVAAQNVVIPDQNFKSALLNNSQINTNGDGEIQTSEAGAFTGTINVPNLSIRDLTGIEAFTAVSRLYVNNNLLTSIDLSANTALVALRCNHNNLTSLDVSANIGLTDLRFYVNQIAAIDLSMLASLEILHAFQNQLSTIDVSHNTALREIKVDFNLLTELDLNANTALTSIDCKQNQLQTLKVRNGNNTNITYFNAIRNVDLLCIEVDDPAYSEANWQSVESVSTFSTDCDQVNEDIVYIPDAAFKAVLVAQKDINLNGDSEIQRVEAVNYHHSIFAVKRNITDLTGLEAFINLRELYVYENDLTTIDVSANPELRVLRFNDNPVSSIDLSPLPHLTTLMAHNTPITSLDVSTNPELATLWCFDSQLASLDVSANSALVDLQVNHNHLTSLTLGSHPALTKLFAYKNQLTSIDISGATAIRDLYIQQNKLTSLDITNHSSLRDLNVGDNMITSLDLTGKTALRSIACYNNLITELDASTIPEFFTFLAYKNKLEVLNVKNGNNTRIRSFDVTRNPSLTCIQVDDPAWSEANWTLVDPQANFSADCGYDGPDVVNIPDANFRARLIQLGVDTNGDHKIQYTEAEAVTGELNLDGAEIHDPTGIEAFINTKRMNWEHNNIPELDVRFNTALEMLDCGYSNVEFLQVNPGLDTLICYTNRITHLNLSNNSVLKMIDFSDNLITGFDIDDYPFAPALEFFASAGNPLVHLDLNSAAKLKFAGIFNTRVSSIDLSQNHELIAVRINSNPNLEFLNVKNGNNTNFIEFSVAGHPLLTCIEVDDTEYAEANFEKEAHTRFSTDCDDSEAIVYIPDPIFKQKLVENSEINLNLDSEIQKSEANNYYGWLRLDNLGISDLTGIEEFINIEVLDVSENNISRIILDNHDRLGYLAARNNQINALSVYRCDYMIDLDVRGNRLESLILPPNLEALNASSNLLTSIDIYYNSSLRNVILNNNKLTKFDLTEANPYVDVLNLENNELTWLNIELGQGGLGLAAKNNQLTCIQVDDPAYAEANWRDDVDPGVEFNTHCEGDPEIVYIPDPNLKRVMLEAVDGRYDSHPDNVPDGEVQYFEAAEYSGGMFSCAGQNIRDLTGIHALIYVEYIDCSNNLLTSITDMNGATGLDCSNNQITEITADLSRLEYFYANNNKLTSLPASLVAFGTYVDNNELTSLGEGWGEGVSFLHLHTVSAAGNKIASVYFADNVQIETLIINDNQLASVDVSDMEYLGELRTTGNPDLTCIEVDDVARAEEYWRDSVDPHTAFSTDCSASAGRMISVSPNPTMGRLTIEGGEVDEVIVFDGISGGMLTRSEGNDLDISHLHSGVYLLKVRSGETVSTTRVVKK